MDYEIVEQKTWKTSLYQFDCESCFLSCVVPCHVYSKIMSTTPLEYTTRIISYIILYTGIQQLVYIQYRLDNSKCPATEIGNCIFADNCLAYYMTINDQPSACRYVEGYCVYSEFQCVKHTHDIMLILFTSLLYTVLTYLHYSARMYVISKKNLDTVGCSDCCASTYCSLCGLAQEYRELV